MSIDNRYRVAVFARNEALHIVTALEGLIASVPKGSDLRIHVLVNGCTDHTHEVAQAFADGHPEVVVVDLPFGDKSNAWNTYVYHLADDGPVHFFTDGDVLCSPHALEHMQAALLADGKSMAIAGLPLSGRRRLQYVGYIHKYHWLFGGLYGAKNAQLEKLRRHQVRLPLGLYGSDHFVSKFMAARSVDPTELHWTQNIYRPDTGFLFRPLAFYRPQDVRLYWRRQITYTLRQLQLPELDSLPLIMLPATTDSVNRTILARLETTPPKATDVVTRAVRQRLRRMYPTPDAEWFERLRRQHEAVIAAGPSHPARRA